MYLEDNIITISRQPIIHAPHAWIDIHTFWYHAYFQPGYTISTLIGDDSKGFTGTKKITMEPKQWCVVSIIMKNCNSHENNLLKFHGEHI